MNHVPGEVLRREGAEEEEEEEGEEVAIVAKDVPTRLIRGC